MQVIISAACIWIRRKEMANYRAINEPRLCGAIPDEEELDAFRESHLHQNEIKVQVSACLLLHFLRIPGIYFSTRSTVK